MLKFAEARARLGTQWRLRRCAFRGKHRFGNDPRFDLQSVDAGFNPRQNDRPDDQAMLERICRAYGKATADQLLARPEYGATSWWEDYRHGPLERVRQALASRDLDSLGQMYRNFFRDPCSAGLVKRSLQTAKSVFGQDTDRYREFVMSDALFRIEYWRRRTGNRFEMRDLAIPETGNPSGVLLDGTLLTTEAEYRHYSAQRIRDLAPSSGATVVEIGGGFGGMAWYLLRDRRDFKYIDFDLPESIALASYYLLNCFPDRKFLLYGEQELSTESVTRFDVILMPPFELAKLAAGSVDVTFSGRTMTGLSPAAKGVYLKDVACITRQFFLNIGPNAESGRLAALIRSHHPGLKLADTRPSEWNRHLAGRAWEEECLYRVGSL